MLDITSIRKDFPILDQQVNGKPLIYLDNAASSMKPLSVIDSVSDYYHSYHSNIHRGAHFLANKATEAYESARQSIADHINARSWKEVNFVRGTTEGINLIAQTWGADNLEKGDVILISEMEHHSNTVPWQLIAEQTGATVRFIPIIDSCELDMDAFSSMLDDRVKIVSTFWISNSIGTVNPVQEIIRNAHQAGAIVMLDAAQAAPHQSMDVQTLDVDFLAFSGHKAYGPTGIGIVYGKAELMEHTRPYQGGGEMIKTVSTSGSTYNDIPFRFEAGTPNIAGGIALGKAIDYLNEIGLEKINDYEHELHSYAEERLQQVEGVRIIGSADNKCAVVSFLLGESHPFDVGVLLDQHGIAIRTGHHCCMPLMERLGVEGTCRASFSFYNTKEEVDVFVETLNNISRLL